VNQNFPEYKETKPSLIIQATLNIFFESGDVFEVRIPKTKYGTISGNFNDPAIAALAITKENGKHQAVYMTVNPIQPALIARNNNKFEYGCQTTTNDAEILTRRWFLIDLDPSRPAGISSTDGELALAFARAQDVKDYLTSIGWPDPIEAVSGNGHHLIYPCNEPNDENSRIDFEFATKMLSSIFTDDRVILDTTSWNASRVWKIYGTISAKGSSTEERPHRVAMITRLPNEKVFVDRGLIDTLAAPLRDAKSEEYKDMTGEYIADMVKWLSDRGITVTDGPHPLYGNEGKKWRITRCPFNPQHEKPIVGLVRNKPLFRCLHNSCSAFHWKEFREKVDPNYKDPDTIFDRLREWCESDLEDIDSELVETACRLGRTGTNKLIIGLKKVVPKTRLAYLSDKLREAHNRFIKETKGEYNERGNIMGVINRTRTMQEAGEMPMYWMADFDGRIRVGKVGDIKCPRLTTTDEILLMAQFHKMGDPWVKQSLAAQAIEILAANYIVNPLEHYLKQFEWDGTPRIHNWLSQYMGVEDNEYTRVVGRKWLISIAARGMSPGCQADYMLILEGKQGIGKSRALRILGGDFYSEYLGGLKGNTHKDMVSAIVGKLIVELAELGTIKHSDMEVLKGILTVTRDDVRLAYERDTRPYPRTCVFAGTTNEVGQRYIADATGARRFWPVHVQRRINLQILESVRDQLLAEAIHAYDSGEDWWPDDALEEVFEEEQGLRQTTAESSDPWFERIKMALIDPDTYNNKCFYIRPEYSNGLPIPGEYRVRVGRVDYILGIICGVETGQQNGGHLDRVRKILARLGFERRRHPSGRKWLGKGYVSDCTREKIADIWPIMIATLDLKTLSEIKE